MARILQQRLASTTLAAALLAAIAAPAMAQPAPAGTPAPAAAATAAAPADGVRGPREHRAPSPEKIKERMEKRAAQLKQKLNLTPAQEPAWTQFTAAMQPPTPGERHAGLDRKGMEQLTTPERIDRMRAARAQRDAEMDRRGDAVKAFYATLSPEQQKTFDAESRHMHPAMGGPRGHHGGKHGHGPHGGPRGAQGEPQGKDAPAVRPAPRIPAPQ